MWYTSNYNVLYHFLKNRILRTDIEQELLAGADLYF